MEKSLLFFVLLPFVSLLGFFNPSTFEKGKNSESGLVYNQRLVQDPKCTDCHSDLLESTLQHGPAAESCENCHTVNLKEHTENGARGLNLAKNVPDLCYKCHTDVKTDLDASLNVHEAMKIENSCTTCHSPHSSDQKKLLVS